MVGTSCKSVDRETSCVAEKVEHVTSLRKAAYQSTVVALIEEETCLLTFSPVHKELVTVLKNHLLIV